MSVETAKNKIDFISAKGEMALLTQTKDWTSTHVGKPEHWPQSLRTALDIILNSKFPMFIWWGEELVCFYNDAYRPSLGNEGKHPSILGQPAKEAWSEIWHIIKPLIDSVLKSGESTWAEDQLIPIYRNGKIEDVYWTFSYSPITNDGKPCGVLVTCVETTEKIKSIKDLEENKNQLHFAIESAELGTWDYNPLTNKFTANYRLKSWFGLQPESEIDLNLALNVIAPKDKQNVKETIQNALQYSSGGKYSTIYTIIHPITKIERIVKANGQALFNENKIAYRFNGTLQDITEEKIAEQKVIENEQRLRTLVDNAPFPIGVYTGKEMRIELVNQTILDIWGKGNDVVGKLYAEVLPELHNQGVYQQLDDVYTTGIPFHAKNQRIDLEIDGCIQPFFFNYSFTPLYDSNGKVYGVMNTAADVTDLNVAKKKVEENEERLSIVIDASELGTWEFDLKNGTPTYSARYLEILGHTHAVPTHHQQLINRIHPEDKEAREKAFAIALETSIFNYEARIIWEDESIHWVEAKGKVYYDEDNKPLKLIGTVRDISEEKYQQQLLIKRERKFRFLANFMPQFVWTSDPKGNLNYFNDAVYNYAGLTEEKVKEQGWLQIVHPDDVDENIRLWSQAINTGNDFIFEHRFRRFDGEYRWQLSRAIPQKDDNGNIQMWVGTSTDIHEMKELDQQKDYFISLASHELKTPITSIKGYVQVLQSMNSDTNDDFTKNALKSVNKQVDKLTHLITDLLDLTKIKTGSLHFNEERFNINKVIKEALEEIRHIHPKYNIAFEKEVDAHIIGDKERIGQVLTNLLTNAVKYSPGANNINVSSEIKNGHVIVYIEDYGVGISKLDQEKIFERFYRVEGRNEKTFPGFGIGLFISSEIIRRHHGTIGVKSNPGKGSTFYFSLPIG